ncbi:hypothetical protein EYC59_03315 [Candidatus Saccharibacteria bacterium]|nr:MAG: hypothetical protein EYC59_03315 [Candidatus Saccharibacteria bacterium]
MSRVKKQLRELAEKRYFRASVFMLAFAALGLVALQLSRAATPTANYEAEAGTRSGTACTASDSGASGGQAVKFSTTTCSGIDTSPLASLPKVAWEGGPQYWAQFSKTAAAGWTNPSFFPILIDSDPFSSGAEVQWDKDHGINGYIGGLNEYTPWSLLQQYGMYYVGDKYTSLSDGKMPDNFPNLVGYRLGDETDGIYPNPQDGYNFLNGLITQYGNRTDGRFMYNNYTQQVVQSAWAPGSTYVNNFTDAVSMDMYWYTIPGSSFTSHGAYVSSVGGPTNPRSATSYGAMVRGLRQVDEQDGKKQPIWMFVENLDGGPGEQYTRQIATGELKGAVWSSVINEARGIMWFNSAMPTGDPCSVGNVIRTAQYNANFCGKTQVQAMGEVNNQVKALAPVINTQSYQYTFGSNLETMLKWYNGSAYIFAMASNGSTPGNRTFTLPSGINSASSVTVVDESRTVPVNGGQFTDNFAAEYSYHIYKVTP